MPIMTIVTIAVLIYAGLLVLINLLLAGRKNWIMGCVRVGVTVVAALGAIPITLKIAEVLSGSVFDFLVPELGAEVNGFLTDVPIAGEGARVLVAMLASPILYLLVFILVRAVLSIIASIVGKLVPVLRGHKLRGVAMLLGAANGLLIAVVTLIPLCGFIMLGANLLNTVSEAATTATAVAEGKADSASASTGDGVGVTYLAIAEDNGAEDNELADEITHNPVAQIVFDLEKHPAIRAVYGSVGEPIFRMLTTSTLHASSSRSIPMNLENELMGVTRTVIYASSALDSIEKEDYTPDDKELLFLTADSVMESPWVKILATDTMVVMSEHWLDGEEFLGMSAPAPDPNVAPTFNRLLQILSTESEQVIETDLHTILDVMGDFLAYDLLSGEVDPTEMVKTLGTSGLMSTTLAKLEANPHLSPLSGEIRDMSVRMVANMLGTDSLTNGEHAPMIDNMASTLTDALVLSEEERDEMILDAVNTAFVDYGYEVPDELALELADQLVQECGQDDKIESEELTNFLVNKSLSGDLSTDSLPGDLPVELP